VKAAANLKLLAANISDASSSSSAWNERKLASKVNTACVTMDVFVLASNVNAFV
jgi:hypothetical protein